MKISIITASYNYAQYISECIESVIAQTYSDWELIVVDDGSSDNSVEIIKSYCKKDSRIKFFQHDADCKQDVADPFNASNQVGVNRGLKETILLGISKCTGEYIAFLESDDAFKPDNLMKKVEVIEKNPSVKLVFNKVEFLWDENRTKRKQKDFENTQKMLSKQTFPRNMFYDFYINNKILTFSCVMVEKNVLKNVEEADFNTPTDALLDWWLWIHLAYKNDFYYVDEALTLWNLHSESYTLNYKKKSFVPTQVLAYKDVYLKNKNDKKLLAFMLYSDFRLFFVRGYRFLRRLGGNLKSKLGL